MAKRDDDVVELLLHQHEEIKRLFAQVEKRTGKARAESFDRLRHLLAVHETAEEEIVHPFARTKLSRGESIVDSRLKEENTAKQTLQELERLGPDAPEFGPKFAEFQKAVIAHAEHEEHEEFAQIRGTASPQQIKGMAAAVKMAEAVAPTHPHPGTESPTKNVVAGPFAAVVDRTRDAIRKAMN
jgi:hemerythrin superfamily protein